VIDLQPFPAYSNEGAKARPFTMGRVSRDVTGKHHAQDASLYRMLIANGIRVRIMGGTCLADQLQGVNGIELLPAGAESATEFYRSLDVFFYRTGTIVEAYGRVVIEAMASGLPLVAGSAGGYTDLIREGVSGFLVHSQEQAFDALMMLKGSTATVAQMGIAARQDAIARHGTETNAVLVQSWLLS
jgi:glycosyltransferase involved in cell wall biosynthesis